MFLRDAELMVVVPAVRVDDGEHLLRFGPVLAVGAHLGVVERVVLHDLRVDQPAVDTAPCVDVVHVRVDRGRLVFVARIEPRRRTDRTEIRVREDDLDLRGRDPAVAVCESRAVRGDARASLTRVRSDDSDFGARRSRVGPRGARHGGIRAGCGTSRGIVSLRGSCVPARQRSVVHAGGWSNDRPRP